MITLRNTATAFLKNNGRYLIMKRAEDKDIAAGFYSGVGGHMEQHELNNPLSACYREVEEETGIGKDEIISLRLLYIIMRRSKDEIRQNYVYFGETTQTEFIQSDEGKLFWADENELLNYRYTKAFTAMLRHYAKRSPGDKTVYVGTAGSDNGFQMTWARCEDFE